MLCEPRYAQGGVWLVSLRAPPARTRMTRTCPLGCYMTRGIEFLLWERPAVVLNHHPSWVLPGSVRVGALEGQGEAAFSPLTLHTVWPSWWSRAKRPGWLYGDGVGNKMHGAAFTWGEVDQDRVRWSLGLHSEGCVCSGPRLGSDRPMCPPPGSASSESPLSAAHAWVACLFCFVD